MLERVLAIDYGRKRIGLACSDPLGITANPLDTLFGEPKQNLARIVEICLDREVGRIVLGLPINMNDTEGEMAQEVRAFGAKLAALTKLPVEFSDERLTSYAAEQDLRALHLKKKLRHKKGIVDAMAAVTILRDWLASRERKS